MKYPPTGRQHAPTHVRGGNLPAPAGHYITGASVRGARVERGNWRTGTPHETAPAQRSQVHLAAGSPMRMRVGMSSMIRTGNPEAASRATAQRQVRQHHGLAGMTSGGRRPLKQHTR